MVLAYFFRRNGYVRLPDKKLRKELGQKYKKGYEVRLVANSQEELNKMRQLLMRVGFRPGKPFQKRKQFVQPIYGKRSVEAFLAFGQSVEEE